MGPKGASLGRGVYDFCVSIWWREGHVTGWPQPSKPISRPLGAEEACISSLPCTYVDPTPVLVLTRVEVTYLQAWPLRNLTPFLLCSFTPAQQPSGCVWKVALPQDESSWGPQALLGKLPSQEHPRAPSQP